MLTTPKYKQEKIMKIKLLEWLLFFSLMQGVLARISVPNLEIDQKYEWKVHDGRKFLEADRKNKKNLFHNFFDI